MAEDRTYWGQRAGQRSYEADASRRATKRLSKHAMLTSLFDVLLSTLSVSAAVPLWTSLTRIPSKQKSFSDCFFTLSLPH